jgi:hypothetical protein
MYSFQITVSRYWKGYKDVTQSTSYYQRLYSRTWRIVLALIAVAGIVAGALSVSGSQPWQPGHCPATFMLLLAHRVSSHIARCERCSPRTAGIFIRSSARRTPQPPTSEPSPQEATPTLPRKIRSALVRHARLRLSMTSLGGATTSPSRDQVETVDRIMAQTRHRCR